jgi:hypothetical protein
LPDFGQGRRFGKVRPSSDELRIDEFLETARSPFIYEKRQKSTDFQYEQGMLVIASINSDLSYRHPATSTTTPAMMPAKRSLLAVMRSHSFSSLLGLAGADPHLRAPRRKTPTATESRAAADAFGNAALAAQRRQPDKLQQKVVIRSDSRQISCLDGSIIP